MSAEVFLDTNILAHCFDRTNPEMQNISKELVVRKNWIVSWQVVQEFSSLAKNSLPHRADGEGEPCQSG